MEKLNFPLLRACDIECRIGTQKKQGNDIVGVSLLLYKDARCDMAILDEVVGAMNWKREHSIKENIINGQRAMLNYCRVSIFNPQTQEWVYKEDVGTESNTENAKGESSDAYKRACVNWGIGRELYTAPFIWVKANQGEDIRYTKFQVTFIHYNENKEIDGLEIKDNKGVVRFTFGNLQTISDADYESLVENILLCNDRDEMMALWARVQSQMPAATKDCRVREKFAAHMKTIEKSQAA